MHEFENWCGLPNIHGAIDETHILIFKLFEPFAKDYYYHKSGGYCVVTQTMVDCNKQFLDLFVGSLGSVNDSWMLQKSGLYNKVMHQDLLNFNWGCQDWLPPYILGYKGYPLLSWIMVSHKEREHSSWRIVQ